MTCLRRCGFFLTEGQPVANAGIPTLELHIAVLRDLIVENGVSPGRNSASSCRLPVHRLPDA